jgi:hypothetical protein
LHVNIMVLQNKPNEQTATSDYLQYGTWQHMAEFIDLCWCCFGLNPTAENFFIEWLPFNANIVNMFLLARWIMFPPRLCNAICRTAKFQNIYINIYAKKNLHVNRMVLQNKPNEQTATEVVLLMFFKFEYKKWTWYVKSGRKHYSPSHPYPLVCLLLLLFAIFFRSCELVYRLSVTSTS